MTETLKQRTIRSFVLRAGRMTDAQEKAYQTLWDEYGLVFHHHRLNLQEAFGREAPLVLEIGFGMGDSLLNQAIHEPHRDFLGVEVHKPGVGRLMNEAKKAGVTNLRVICEDAVEVLADGLGPQSLEGVQIYFPDPWHKKRHHKRRIIQPSFINLLAHRVRLGGFCHLIFHSLNKYVFHFWVWVKSGPVVLALHWKTPCKQQSGCLPRTKLQAGAYQGPSGCLPRTLA